MHWAWFWTLCLRPIPILTFIFISHFLLPHVCILSEVQPLHLLNGIFCIQPWSNPTGDMFCKQSACKYIQFPTSKPSQKTPQTINSSSWRKKVDSQDPKSMMLLCLGPDGGWTWLTWFQPQEMQIPGFKSQNWLHPMWEIPVCLPAREQNWN